MKKYFNQMVLPVLLTFIMVFSILPIHQANAGACSHTWKSRKRAAATCTVGEQWETYCTKCGTIRSVDTVSPPLGHNYHLHDDSGVVSIYCNRCKLKLKDKVYSLDEFSRYYKGQGKIFSYYVTAAQNAILSCWLRYSFDFSDKAVADKMVEYSRKSNASTLYPKDVKRAQKFIEALALLSEREHKKGSKTIKDFPNADNLCKGLSCNAYIGFLDLRGDIRNDKTYKIFKWAITGAGKVLKVAKISSTFAKWIIDGYAKICNAGITLCYAQASKSEITDLDGDYYNISFYEFIKDLDGKYYRSYGKTYGNAYEVQHNLFIKYVNYRINLEFEEIYGVQLSSLSGL